MVLICGYGEQAEQQAVDDTKILQVIAEDFVQPRLVVHQRDETRTEQDDTEPVRPQKQRRTRPAPTRSKCHRSNTACLPPKCADEACTNSLTGLGCDFEVKWEAERSPVRTTYRTFCSPSLTSDGGGFPEM